MAGFFTYIVPYGFSAAPYVEAPPSGRSGVIGAVLEQQTVLSCRGFATMPAPETAVFGAAVASHALGVIATALLAEAPSSVSAVAKVN